MAISNSSLHQYGMEPNAYARRRDVFDVTADYAADKTGSFLKALYVLPNFFMEFGWLASDHAGLNGFTSGAKMTKLSLKPWTLVGKVQDTQATLAGWLRGSNKQFKEKYGQGQERQITALDVLRDASGCVADAYETTELLAKTFISVPKEALRIFGGFSGVAFTFAMSCNLLLNTFTWINASDYNSLQGAKRDKAFTEMTGYLFKAVMEISYIVLGIMIVLSSFFQVVFSPLTFSAASATAIVFGILEYYHENLGTVKQLKG